MAVGMTVAFPPSRGTLTTTPSLQASQTTPKAMAMSLVEPHIAGSTVATFFAVPVPRSTLYTSPPSSWIHPLPASIAKAPPWATLSDCFPVLGSTLTTQSPDDTQGPLGPASVRWPPGTIAVASPVCLSTRTMASTGGSTWIHRWSPVACIAQPSPPTSNVARTAAGAVGAAVGTAVVGSTSPEPLDPAIEQAATRSTTTADRTIAPPRGPAVGVSHGRGVSSSSRSSSRVQNGVESWVSQRCRVASRRGRRWRRC